MIYVSQCIGKSKFVIIDTDDNAREVYTRAELIECCEKLGIDIKGMHQAVGGYWVIEPYPINMTKAQAKVKLFLGVDLTVNESKMITKLVCNGEPKDIVLRLSDYGTACSDYILDWHTLWNYKGHLTIVVDDRVGITTKTFAEIADFKSITIDIRELTDAKKIKMVYNSFINKISNRPLNSIKEFIENNRLLDSSIQRYNEHLLIMAIKTCNLRNETRGSIQEVLGFDPNIYKSLIDRAYKKSFDSLASSEIVLQRTGNLDFMVKSYFSYCRSTEVLSDLALLTNTSRMIDSFAFFKRCTTLSGKALDIMLNYCIIYSDIDVLKTYAKLCRKVADKVNEVLR